MREDIIPFHSNWKLCVMFDSNPYTSVTYIRVMCIHRGIFYVLYILKLRHNHMMKKSKMTI